MQIDKIKVMEALRSVIDPKSGNDIISMKMVKDLSSNENDVNFTVIVPSNQTEHRSDLNFNCIAAVNSIYPEANVNIHMEIAAAPQGGNKSSALPHVKNIIAVASGKGGVGKSTISVNLALGLKKLGHKVGLIDADLYGPSIPTMLGLSGSKPRIKEVYGKSRIIPIDCDGMQVMSIGFIVEPEQAVVLRGPRLAGLLTQFFNDVIWDDLDYLVVDLPPGTGDIQLTMVQSVPVTGAIMVTTPQEIAVVDAVKAMNMFLLDNIQVPIVGVVENMSWFTPAELPDNKYKIFGEGGGALLAQKAETELIAQIPIVQAIREGGDAGRPIISEDNAMSAHFMEMTKNVVASIEKRNNEKAPTNKVEMTTGLN